MLKFLRGKNLIILALMCFVGVAIGGQSLFAIGTKLIENYQGIIKFNAGYYSALPIQTTSTLTSAGIVNSGTLVQTGNGTIGGTFGVTGATTLGTVTTGIVNSNGASGSGVLASTTMETTATALASYVTDYRCWAFTPNVANTALTLPASSTLSTFLPTAGTCHTIKLENVSSVNATTTTIVAGTGMDLQEPDGQDVVIGGTNYANIEFCRRSDTDFVVTVDETIVAD